MIVNSFEKKIYFREHVINNITNNSILKLHYTDKLALYKTDYSLIYIDNRENSYFYFSMNIMKNSGITFLKQRPRIKIHLNNFYMNISISSGEH